jgi:hypothetical protein
VRQAVEVANGAAALLFDQVALRQQEGGGDGEDAEAGDQGQQTQFLGNVQSGQEHGMGTRYRQFGGR